MRNGKRYLVTGPAGFIGSHLVKRLLEDSEVERVIGLDKFTYAGDMRNIEGSLGPRFKVLTGDVASEELVDDILADGVDGVFHLAAESHVDKSLHAPRAFILPNILGAVNVMEACRRYHVRCLMVSTDEVYGDSDDRGVFEEGMLLDPSSPYSWSKACADMYGKVLRRSFAADDPQIIRTRGNNHVGTGQQWEKFIPRLIAAAIEGNPAYIYGDGMQMRSWLDVRDGADGLYYVMKHGVAGEVYNLGTEDSASTVTNLEMAQLVFGLATGKPEEEAPITYGPDRPGHDRSYHMKVDKLHELGWQPQFSLEETLRWTVGWYKQPINVDWWKACRTRDEEFRRKNYDERRER